MKFELIIDGSDINYNEANWLLTVSQTELFECYHRNKEFCLAELNYIIKMYCSANHFDWQLTELELQKIMKNCKLNCESVAFNIKRNKRGKLELNTGYFEIPKQRNVK